MVMGSGLLGALLVIVLMVYMAAPQLARRARDARVHLIGSADHSENRGNKYLDILTLMQERTASYITAFSRSVDPCHVYEGAGTHTEVTRAVLDALEQQQADLGYLIAREHHHD